jgi:hypothetical protein
MALNKQLVDGKQTLAEQERALNFAEQVTFAKVINYCKLTANLPAGTTPNEAILQDVPIGGQPKPLHLAALDPATDPAPVISKQLQAGKIVVFHDVAFVSGKEQMVLGSR